jgi:hypothetical protein
MLDIYKIKITSDGISVERADGGIITDKEKEVILENMLSTLEKDAIKMTNRMMEELFGSKTVSQKESEKLKSATISRESDKQKLDNVLKTIKNLEEDARKKVADLDDVRARIHRLKDHREELKVRLKREISDSDSPRCGLPWEVFEKEHSEEKFADFVYDLAKKYGRSTLSIRFRLLRLLVDKLPKENLIRKVESMMR